MGHGASVARFPSHAAQSNMRRFSQQRGSWLVAGAAKK
jgi:hypothetical protein